LSHFHATVKWNDGDTFSWFGLSLPDLADAPIASDGNGGFTVSASATFPQFGWFHYQVLISDDRLATGDGSIVGAAYGQAVIDSPIRPIPLAGGVVANAGGGLATSSAVSGKPNAALSEHVKFSAVKIKRPAGKAFSGTVGQLSGLAAGTSVSELTGTINWGDGTSSAAQFVAGKKGKIRILGLHTFSSAGNHTITIGVTQAITMGGSSQVQDPPIQLPRGESTAQINQRRNHAGRGKGIGERGGGVWSRSYQ